MRTIISGPVTADDLADAELMAGITPTSFVTNGLSTPPADTGLPTNVMPICPMLPDCGEEQRNATMTLYADALIVRGRNPHLVGWANRNALIVYEVPA